MTPQKKKESAPMCGGLIPLPQKQCPSSSCFVLSCSRRRFSPGSPEETTQNASAAAGCSVLSVFRSVFPANQEPQHSTCTTRTHTNLHPRLCLSTALVATATQLIQEDVTLTRRVGQSVSFSCRGTEECDGSVTYWYQKKDTETFERILYIWRNSGSIYKYNHPQTADFSSVDKGKGYELQIQTVGPSHSASYYCACWKYDSSTHSEKRLLKSVQKPPDAQTSTSVSDTNRTGNHGNHPIVQLHLTHKPTDLRTL
ncbi:uncharacterized protein LOC115410424 [Sphaeramia orbicularis]|uniref:uncharacterized protein LOC115410424 n=1 Tax=Sphaeramia orbicularis TaxID=375764 RepID=UPI00117E04F0|nr:uncharacterized protein LOC115410424 [Sphaeramia orbicularis]